MQSVVDALRMTSDAHSVFDIVDSTFSKGYKISDLSLAQVNTVLRKVEDTIIKSRVVSHRQCSDRLVKKVTSVWKDRVQQHLMQT